MMTYLDNAATTFQKPESVYQAMDEANRHFSVNAGRGSYALARNASGKIAETRQLIRDLTRAEQGAEVVFTASATFAFNAIIGGLDWKEKDVVYVSPYEHNAVMRTLCGYQQKIGFEIKELPLNTGTFAVDLDKTAYLFAKFPPTYLFLNMVSNVTGYVLPAGEICEEAKKHNCITVLDGAQALGALPVSMKELQADFLVFAGHKALCGPFGIGGYINNSGVKLHHVFFGGTGSSSLEMNMPEGEAGYEPGSPNVVAIAGLRAALQEITTPDTQKQFWNAEQSTIRKLIDKLSLVSGIHLYTAPDKLSQAGILSFNLEGYSSQELGRILDEDFEIAVRTGYHCAPLIHKYLYSETFAGTVRVSIGRFTKEEDIHRLTEALGELG